MRFREAMDAVKDMHTLYLPAPTDILMLEPDGSVTPGIGHVLYVVKNDKKNPVRYQLVKLPEGCAKWSPCQVEALAR